MAKRDPTAYLDDMIEFGERVLAWLADRMRYDATLRNLELIGEAATRVPNEIREQAPDISWRLVIGTRNRLAHAYLGIEAETIWLIIRDKVPDLLAQLQALLTRLG